MNANLSDLSDTIQFAAMSADGLPALTGFPNTEAILWNLTTCDIMTNRFK